ncbi:MAG: hypothetical protein D6760_00675 [Deltaproteobacteria bacterium]|nr:MAG: hypothetical protein D6760_00675 [Deltaproteobacteria bacterium]
MPTFELLSPGKYLPGDYWKQIAPATERVEVEIGPGDGGFLLASAAAHPDTLFVGIEVRRAWAEKLRGRAAGLCNVEVVHGDARWIVEFILASESIDRYHLYFPDPWWKKRHHKRRLFTEGFCRGVARTLRPGGEVLLVTDVEVVRGLAEQGLEAAGLDPLPWSRDPQDPAQSSYERKYRRQGRRLFEAKFVKP